MKISYFVALGAAACFSAFAGGPDVAQPPPAQNIFYCPPINALRKDPDTLTWSAPGGWKSHDTSFVDKITRFSGAQWRGAVVGQIFCVYRPAAELEFPVLLAFKTLAYAPQQGKWTGNLGGYQNCESPLQEDCPFSIRLKPEEENLYEQAAQLKKPITRSQTPGF